MERTKPQRLYSEEEVGLIIERAAKSQRQSMEPSGRALSLTDLEQIATESGLSPEHIRQAIAELDARPRGFSRILGAPTRIHLETELPGEISPEAFDLFITEARRLAEDPGEASAVGRLLTISTGAPHSSERTHITVSATGGKTLITVDRNMRNVAGGLFGGLGGGLGGGMMAPVVGGLLASTDSPLLAVAGGLAWLGSAALLARTIYRSMFASRSRELQATHQALVDLAQQLLAKPPDPATPGGL